MPRAKHSFVPFATPHYSAVPRPEDWNQGQIWCRQPCDSDTQWAMFHRYLYQRGRPRRMPSQDIETILASTSNGWAQRAEAFDRFIESALEEAAYTALTRAYRAARIRQDVGVKELEKIHEQQCEDGYRAGLVSPAVAGRLAEEGTVMEFALAGRPLPLAPPKGGEDGEDAGAKALAALTDEELETYARLRAKLDGA